MEKELNLFSTIANSRRIRKQKNNILPSGAAPNFVYDNPHIWGGNDCLLPVKEDIVDYLLDYMREDFERMTDWDSVMTNVRWQIISDTP